MEPKTLKNRQTKHTVSETSHMQKQTKKIADTCLPHTTFGDDPQHFKSQISRRNCRQPRRRQQAIEVVRKFKMMECRPFTRKECAEVYQMNRQIQNFYN